VTKEGEYELKALSLLEEFHVMRDTISK